MPGKYLHYKITVNRNGRFKHELFTMEVELSTERGNRRCHLG